MISFSTDRSAQIRATKAKSPNFQSRINSQNNISSQDMFINSSQVNLNKSVPIKRLQPVKPIRTQSFGSGPMMQFHEKIAMQGLMEAQQKVMSRVAEAFEHSGLDEILGQNPHIDKKAWAQDHLEMAKAFLAIDKDDAYSRAHAYVNALKAVQLDESNPQVHAFIKNDLGVPLHRAFDEKSEALLNGNAITDEEAQIAVLSKDEAKKFKKVYDTAVKIKDSFLEMKENAQLAEILGEEPQMDKKALAKVFFEAAQATYEFGMNNPAARVNAYGIARTAAGIDPNNPAVHFFLGTKLGVHPQEALVHVSEAVRQKPFEPDFLKAKMDFDMILGQKDDFMKTAQRALSISPNDPELYFLRGVVHHKNGDVESASADYKKVAELNPKNLTARANLGLIEFEKNHPIQAVSYYDEVEKAFQSIEPEIRTPEDINIFANSSYNRGVIYMNLKVMDKAHESYSKAIEADPKMFEPRFNRAMVSFYQGDYTAAIKDLDVAIENADPLDNPVQNASSKAFKALNLIHLGKDDKAQQLLKKTQGQFPEYDVNGMMTEIFRNLTGLGQ